MLLLVILLMCIKLADSIELIPGQPVPHADELHQILKTNILNYTDTPEGSLFGYLFSNNAPNNSSFNTENLDINVLDVDNIKKIVALAKKKYQRHGHEQFRRKKESLNHNPHLVEVAMRQMQQSIYSTRYRIATTGPLRKRFREVESYNIAILVGSLNQILLKMENLYAQMVHFPVRTHFLWYLIIYEKLIAGHVDVTYIVKKIFQLHEKHLKNFK